MINDVISPFLFIGQHSFFLKVPPLRGTPVHLTEEGQKSELLESVGHLLHEFFTNDFLKGKLLN
ncbi:MAG: hypothetical protein WAK10_07800 [Methanoregula sp.]